MSVIAMVPGDVQTLIDAATVAGVAKSNQFSVLQSPVGVDKIVEWTVTGTFTVCTVDLEESVDNGVSFQKRDGQIGLDLAAKKASFFNAVPGAIYRFNVITFTGTSVTLKGRST